MFTKMNKRTLAVLRERPHNAGIRFPVRYKIS